MSADPERYRFAADSLHGVATVAIHCASCTEARGEPAGTVQVFDYLYPSLGDVQNVIDQHETSRHTPAAA